MAEVILLSRIQFAVTVIYHFLFVPLTLGLVVLVALMETRYARTGNELYRRMADYWGKLFTINFALGIVTGITMEFQFGTNWSEYSKFMGDIFGSPLAIEALLAFFLESTFIGVWLFGKERFPKLRALSMWMVAIGTNISALWIITANGFMQNPVGYTIQDGRIKLESFLQVVTNSYTWYMFFHTVLASYIVGAFFVLGVSAYHLLRKQHVEFYKKSFQFGLVMALVATLAVPLVGHFQGIHTAKVQPAKAAAFEAVWESGPNQPFTVFSIPDPANERNLLDWGKIPGVGSLMYTNSFSGYVTGLKDIPADQRPNVPAVFWSFRLMVGLGFLFLGLAWYGLYLWRKGRLLDSRRYLKLLLYSIPLPYVAINLGWVVTEMGRQPWIVYGLMKTSQAVSPIALGDILFSLTGLVVFYTSLIVADVYLLHKYAVRGPVDPPAEGSVKRGGKTPARAAQA
ncbi:cytochrome ubiquinol oxidase subunit I [Kyrpidia spormannii]|uniref:Cytochrome ubiquinol oxidase subunit I n=1 Tax=Kyrpidia spormannii TaxID=2055160 RepID=A0A2K8N6Q1_9BACL|nr:MULTISPECIES: cytochrome ubiquinol oxidase subunit I [Kyrpidia]ATY84132.1 cytochrome ubiquinol oxidase subunit I [Kyrpidia spormannii]MCL6577700.1 cytochrome ubiquinol oxidase subunit I [Kyrpidia sp.]